MLLCCNLSIWDYDYSMIIDVNFWICFCWLDILFFRFYFFFGFLMSFIVVFCLVESFVLGLIDVFFEFLGIKFFWVLGVDN